MWGQQPIRSWSEAKSVFGGTAWGQELGKREYPHPAQPQEASLPHTPALPLVCHQELVSPHGCCLSRVLAARVLAYTPCPHQAHCDMHVDSDWMVGKEPSLDFDRSAGNGIGGHQQWMLQAHDDIFHMGTEDKLDRLQLGQYSGRRVSAGGQAQAASAKDPQAAELLLSCPLVLLDTPAGDVFWASGLANNQVSYMDGGHSFLGCRLELVLSSWCCSNCGQVDLNGPRPQGCTSGTGRDFRPGAPRMAALRVAPWAAVAAVRSGSLPLDRCRRAPCSASAVVMDAVPRWLAGLRFDNRALRELPVEALPGPEDAAALWTPRPVPGACFSRARPAPLREPRLVALSEPALALLGLAPPTDAANAETWEAEAARFFSGNALLPGAEPAAHCYCGHQFGQFAGQLGDGAAMYLGEVCPAAGGRWELQLKGAGPTPFSRQADGRKVLRSSIREFLCSEAMFHLGIPTTRAGACVTSACTVVRDIFYDGNPKQEKCTVVLRIAPTFLRFGSFEIFKSADPLTGREGPSVGRNDIRAQMLDYVIGSFYPEIQAAHAEDSQRRNAAFFREVTRRTARMVAEWQCVGFCHGVLNTDNMSIVGLTIDYGPFGFLDRYDPDHVCNASDSGGRYSYSKQPEVCKWNLRKLAEALVPELPLEVGMAVLAEEFDTEFQRHYLQKMRQKLGLVRVELEEDSALVARLLETMHVTGADFTNTFCLLSTFRTGSSSPEQAAFLEQLLQQCASLEELRRALQPQMDPRQLSMMLMLAQSNPQLLALVGSQASLARELERREQHSRLEQLSPAELDDRNRAHWTQWLQEYSARLEKDTGVSNPETWQAEHVRIMHANNPKYVLRNYIAQNAIEAAENGDFSEVRRVLKLLEAPYCQEEPQGAEEPQGTTGQRGSYSSRPPLWAAELCVT
ncbi:protein adenylyltransferase SelO, mitochondrial [Rhynchocyon petersi]